MGFLKNSYIKRKLKSGQWIKFENLNFETAEKVFLKTPIQKKFFVGLVRDGLTPFENYVQNRAYYPKYERFLKNNGIAYQYYNIHLHNWLEEAKNFDIIIWHNGSSPAARTEAIQKIYTLEQIGKKCLPSFHDLIKYEDKVLLHYFFITNNLPEVPTFVSSSMSDALDFAANTKYPIVSKPTTGSSSRGVELIKSEKEAREHIKKVFSRQGKKVFWKYLRQKDYVYFQKFIKDTPFDLRIIIVEDSLFGYYRYPRKGDFRASGSNIRGRKEIPRLALDVAWETKKKFNTHCLAVDLVFSPSEKKYLIIESSIFFGVDSPMQLRINGVPFRYRRTDDGEYVLEEGSFWVQELTLKSFFESII